MTESLKHQGGGIIIPIHIDEQSADQSVSITFPESARRWQSQDQGASPGSCCNALCQGRKLWHDYFRGTLHPLAEGSHSVKVWPQPALTGLSAACGWLSLLCDKDTDFNLEFRRGKKKKKNSGGGQPPVPSSWLAVGPAGSVVGISQRWDFLGAASIGGGLDPLCQRREKEGEEETSSETQLKKKSLLLVTWAHLLHSGRYSLRGEQGWSPEALGD